VISERAAVVFRLGDRFQVIWVAAPATDAPAGADVVDVHTLGDRAD